MGAQTALAERVLSSHNEREEELVQVWSPVVVWQDCVGEEQVSNW